MREPQIRLGSANNLVSGLALEVGRQKQLASAAVLNIGPNTLNDAVTAGTHIPKAAHDAAVTAAVAAATADLVPKASVDQLCSAAKLLGATEGRAAVQAEMAIRVHPCPSAVKIFVCFVSFVVGRLPLPSMVS